MLLVTTPTKAPSPMSVLSPTFAFQTLNHLY